MKVYFGACGIGLGHVGRCVPIAKKLKERGCGILFSTYRDGVKYVEQEGFSVVEAPAIGFKVWPDGTVDFRQTVVNPGPILASFTLLKQVEAEIQFMRAFDPDVVISDSRVSPLIAAKILKIPDVCILNQFQIIIPRRKKFLRLAKLVDTGALAMIGKLWTSGAAHLMIPDFPPPYTLSLGNLGIPQSYQRRVQLIGPILPVHPASLPEKEDLRRKLGLDEELPLIFVPLSGPIKERAYFTGVLRQIFKEFPGDYQVVMSLGYPNASIEPVRYGKMSIYGWISNRFEYLKACDLVISRAGHGTITQAMSYGKPLILVPTPSHTEQLNNANRVAELGVAEVLQQDILNRDILIKTVSNMLKGEKYGQRMEDVCKVVSNMNGLDTAVETIVKVGEKTTLRNA